MAASAISTMPSKMEEWDCSQVIVSRRLAKLGIESENAPADRDFSTEWKCRDHHLDEQITWSTTLEWSKALSKIERLDPLDHLI